jgi:hypothetical protein
MFMAKRHSKEYIKQRTQELYDSLPMDLEERKKCIAVRDEIIQLNYKFFGFVASNTFVENCDYEDKMQTALLSFMGMWWKYKWTPKYRDDLSFAVFFKPRISEEIRRYLSPVSYTVKRVLCMKVASQLGKKWTDVCYDDIAKVTLPPEDITTLKIILGSKMPSDISEYAPILKSESDPEDTNIEKYMTVKYDTVEEMLIQEMIERESKLTDKDLYGLSDLLGIDFDELKAALPGALSTLYKRLTSNL